MRTSHILFGTASLVALALAGPVAAQTASIPAPGSPSTSPAPTAGEEESIVVTGIRESFASSESLKRRAPQVVDAIVAEDIGKLPDLNTAETAARIPGLQVYRQGGEAQNVLVRGLPFFTTTYNGREIFTAETRVVALQDFPSSNIAALEVFKTSTADLVEPGLAGIVNVRSPQAVRLPGGRAVGFGVGPVHPPGRQLPPERQPARDQALRHRHRRDRRAGRRLVPVDALPRCRGLEHRLHRQPDDQRQRRAAARHSAAVLPLGRARPPVGRRRASVEAERRTSSSTPRACTRASSTRSTTGCSRSRCTAAQSYSNLVFRPGTNLVRSGTVTNPGGNLFSFQGATFNRTDTFQIATGAKFKSGPFKLDVDIARTISTFRGSTESLDRTFPGARTVNFNLDQPSFNISGINFGDAKSQTFQGLFEENQRAAGRDWQLRADGQYDFDNSVLKNIQLGVRYADRNAQRNYGNRYAFLLPLGINQTALPLQFAVFNGTNGLQTFNAPTYQGIRDNLAGLRQVIINNCAAIRVTDPGNGCVALSEHRAARRTGVLPRQREDDRRLRSGQLRLRRQRHRHRRAARRERQTVPAERPGGRGDGQRQPRDDRSTCRTPACCSSCPTAQLQARFAFSKTVTRPDFSQLGGITFGQPPAGNVGKSNASLRRQRRQPVPAAVHLVQL